MMKRSFVSKSRWIAKRGVRHVRHSPCVVSKNGGTNQPLENKGKVRRRSTLAEINPRIDPRAFVGKLDVSGDELASTDHQHAGCGACSCPGDESSQYWEEHRRCIDSESFPAMLDGVVWHQSPDLAQVWEAELGVFDQLGFASALCSSEQKQHNERIGIGEANEAAKEAEESDFSVDIS